MKKITAPLFSHTGFTLIELLIVIALLGALAIGLLATIDPFEQLKKGRDTSARNTVSEFYNANLRYYAIKSKFPWDIEPTSGNLFPAMSSEIQKLIDQGELKSKFIELAGTTNLGKMYVYSSASDHVAVCFAPESKSFKGDPNTIYDSSGSTGGGIVCQGNSTASGATGCYFCIQ